MSSVVEQPSNSSTFADIFNTTLENVRSEPWDKQSVVPKAKTMVRQDDENRLPSSPPALNPDSDLIMRDEVPDTEREYFGDQGRVRKSSTAALKGRDGSGEHNRGIIINNNESGLVNGSSERLAAPFRPVAVQRQGSHNSADEGDSVLDLYGSRVSSTSGLNNNEVYPNVNSSSTAMYDLTGDPDNAESSRWIHRDKLLRIESQENGSSVDEARGGASRWGGAGISKRETQQSTFSQPYYPSNVTPSRPANIVDDEEDPDEAEIYELKRPGERSVERTPMKSARRVGSAGSYSRIPLSTTSPIPVPLEYIERTTPLRRRESNSPELQDGVLSIQPRMRSKSVGSNTQLDSDGTPGKHSRNFSSQANSKTPTPSSPRRPSSANRPGHTKNRSRSQPGVGRSNPNAPATGSTSKHTPQGPPPWSLSAYSPDPKLPPDQQLIPTVAKRLQQEQWERDGVYASVYDRKLRPLKVHDGEGDGQRASGEDDENEWPLKRNTHSDDNPQPVTSPIPPAENSNANKEATDAEARKDLESGQLPPGKSKSRSCCGCTIM